MRHLTIRNLPDDVHETLKEEASASHVSTTRVVLAALTEYAETIRRRQRLTQVIPQMNALRRKIHRRIGKTTDSARLLRADRTR
ncbi:MAG: hypothetical protein HY816_04555 [Candidatus Wallbacteria bacterium]|nr:hypothetical protein [Candidatus Wallbacteria bacterium]